MLCERFLSSADIVNDVTEKDKGLSWKERKLKALEHIKTMEGPSLWVKTADVISNLSELLEDYKKDKDDVFNRFNASKEDTIANYQSVLRALLKRWQDISSDKFGNPMVADLKTLDDNIRGLSEE